MAEWKLQGVPELLVCLVRNLLENAVRACEEGGKIQILWEEGQLRILDDGIGMEAGELEKILEPFYRVDKARSRERGGSGLGLALCAEIIQLHRGEIRVESEQGKGTEIFVIFTTL